VPWTGFEVVVATLALNAVAPVLVFTGLSQSSFYQQVYGPDFPAFTTAPGFEATAAVAGVPAAAAVNDQQAMLLAVRGLWVGVIALPLQLAIIVLARYAVYPVWRSPFSARAIPARVALAVVVAAILTPLVLLLHAAVNLLFASLDLPREDHPLSKLSAARPLLDQVLFFVQASVAAPLIEELLFRGLLLGWLVGGRSFFDPLLAVQPSHAAGRRVRIVLGISVAVAAYLGRAPDEVLAGPTRGPVLFVIALVAGWVLLRLVFRRKRRTVGAVYASAALFAVVHSSVWPTPIPLFALGLGLGWLAVRTRGILAPAVVHGLFNAVSVLFVLRGS
jgi:membrane protease YdiL (CAAX protease family)